APTGSDFAHCREKQRQTATRPNVRVTASDAAPLRPSVRVRLRIWKTPSALSTRPTTHHRATKASASVASKKKIETASFSTPRIPEGAVAQLSARFTRDWG